MKNAEVALASNALMAVTNFYSGALAEKVQENERMLQELQGANTLAQQHHQLQARVHAARVSIQGILKGQLPDGAAADVELYDYPTPAEAVAYVLALLDGQTPQTPWVLE